MALALAVLGGCRLVPQVPPTVNPDPAPPAPPAPELPTQHLAPPANAALAWERTFDQPGKPSSRDWTWDTERNRLGWYNDELQYYASARRDNARVEGGALVIEARREDLSQAGLRDWGKQHYSSARLTTRGHHKWYRGFFEVTAKLPCVRGAWPAIWLLPDPDPGRWLGGEIDIAEHVGHEPDRVYHAVHTPRRNFQNGNQRQTYTPLNPCRAFHDYQLSWTAEEVLIGIDGVPSFSAPAFPFDRPMALVLNVAIGGTWAGVQGIDDAGLPARMEVRRIRVWQGPESR